MIDTKESHGKSVNRKRTKSKVSFRLVLGVFLLHTGGELITSIGVVVGVVQLEGDLADEI
jgi:hypothetical protein